MAGFLLYYVCGFGLAQWIPGVRGAYAMLPASRHLMGVMLIGPVFYIEHIVLGLSVRFSAYGLVTIGGAGLIALVREWATQPRSRMAFHHPVWVLPALVVAVVIFRGGVGYLPYLSDEFSNWINVTKQIFALNGYRPDEMVFAPPGYPPAWPLTLLFPQMFSGRYDHAIFALAPVVLHIGLLGLVYDVMRVALRRLGKLEPLLAGVFAWSVLLLLLLAEASGQLVARNLLIEPPQVYGFSAIMVVVFALFLPDAPRRPLCWVIGWLFAYTYMLKEAALTIVPALVVLAVILILTDESATVVGDREVTRRGSAASIHRVLGFGWRLFLPGFVFYVSWKLFDPSIHQSGLASPFLVFTLDNALRVADAEVVDVVVRLAQAVGNYVATYKLPVSVAATLGIVAALRCSPKAYVALAVVVFVVIYFFAVFWYQAMYYGEILRSVERYSRIPIRVYHLLGLMLLIIELAQMFQRFNPNFVSRFSVSRLGLTVAFAVIVGLFFVQVWQTDRRVVDLTTRKFQSVIPYMLSMPEEARRLRSILGKRFYADPRIVVIEQDGNDEVHETAYYYLIPDTFGGGVPRLRFEPYVSWGPNPRNGFTRLAAEGDMIEVLRKADVIWPVRLDDWMRRQLDPLIADPSCRATPEAFFLTPRTGSPLTLTCEPKRLP